MSKISLIAAVDEDGGLGVNNALLCHLPADLQHFKKLTLGKPILMGRNTFTSIGRVLPNRRNIIISRTLNDVEGADIFSSLTEALAALKNEPELMVIGGGTIFRQVLPLAGRIFLTVIHHHFNADVFFPALDFNEWVCTHKEERAHDEKNPYDLTFYTYEKAHPLS